MVKGMVIEDQKLRLMESLRRSTGEQPSPSLSLALKALNCQPRSICTGHLWEKLHWALMSHARLTFQLLIVCSYLVGQVQAEDIVTRSSESVCWYYLGTSRLDLIRSLPCTVLLVAMRSQMAAIVQMCCSEQKLHLPNVKASFYPMKGPRKLLTCLHDRAGPGVIVGSCIFLFHSSVHLLFN